MLAAVRRSPLLVAAVLCLAPLASAPLAAQVPDSVKQRARSDTIEALKDTLKREARQDVLANAHTIRWYEALAGVAGVVALMPLDQPMQRWMQRHRSNTTNDVASVFRQEGEPLFYAGVSLGTLAVGVAAGNADIQRAGGRMVAAVGLAAATTGVLKVAVGRSRPNEGVGAFQFHPFTSLSDTAGIEARGSMPSGHTMAAFAIATSLADDIHSPVVDVLLYTFAAGTAFSRINDNRHWLSDTAAGALIGVTAGKLVSGRWRIFGLKPPGFLVTPTGATAVSWTVPLPDGRAGGGHHAQ